MRLVLLPGMDGTGELFARFVAACPPVWETQVVSFPTDVLMDHAFLAALIRSRKELPRNGPYVLLGESFSGPLALRLAAEAPEGLAGVVLCATFVSPPRGARLASRLVRVLRGAPPPRWALRRLLTGGDTELAEDVARAIATVSPAVIAHRLTEIAEVNARDDLRLCPVPVLALSATRDRVVGPAAAAEIARLRPDAAVVGVEAPHLLLQSAAGAAWDAITGWAEGLLG